jgi:hypothetical protein
MDRKVLTSRIRLTGELAVACQIAEIGAEDHRRGASGDRIATILMGFERKLIERGFPFFLSPAMIISP